MLGAVFIVLTVLSSALCQDCPIVRSSDLGSTDVPSNDGLLGYHYALQGAQVAIEEIEIVCLSQGEMRNEYHSASVIANVETTFNTSLQKQLIQLDLQCANGGWMLLQPVKEVSGSTAQRIDCISCKGSESGSSSLEHCVGKVTANFCKGDYYCKIVPF